MKSLCLAVTLVLLAATQAAGQGITEYPPINPSNRAPQSQEDGQPGEQKTQSANEVRSGTMDLLSVLGWLVFAGICVMATCKLGKTRSVVRNNRFVERPTLCTWFLDVSFALAIGGATALEAWWLRLVLSMGHLIVPGVFGALVGYLIIVLLGERFGSTD